MLLQQLSNTLDLPHQMALSEAQKKLTNTYMLCDGKVVKVENFGDEGSIHYHNDIEHFVKTNVEVKSLEPFLPDSGVYVLPCGVYSVIKHPKRQWKKSFSYDFYNVEKLKHTGEDATSCELFTFISKTTPRRRGIWKHDDSIFYYEHRIAKIGEQGIIFFSPLYMQEVNEMIERGEL